MFKLQLDVICWCAELMGNKPVPVDQKAVSLHLLEEALEVCLALGCTPAEIENETRLQLVRQSSKFDKPVVRDELSNCLIVLLRLAGLRGVDLEEQGIYELERNRKLRWDVLKSGDFRKRR